MDRETVVKALHATTVADDQKQAGEYLDKLSVIDGFAPELLQIACEATYPGAVRQAAVIYFKNTILKFWEVDPDDAAQQAEHGEFKLSQRDRQLIMDNILEAVCVAGDNTRPQLCVAAQSIMRTEFPDKWPGIVPAIKTKLATPDGNALLGALLLLYRMSKIYEYKRSKERQPLIETMKELLPVLQHHFAQFESNGSQESVTIQKLILKVFHSLIQFSLNLEMMTTGMDCWINFCKNVLVRPCPPEIDAIEDEDERAHMVWWKCKKWAAKILDRVFERYGAPGQVESDYAEFANHFLNNFSIPCVEVMTQILNEHAHHKYVSQRVLYLALSFLNTAVSHSHTWKVLKPHAQEIVETILFPLLCHTDDDEEMWEDDAEEYVRFKYDIFEDMHNPAYGAGSLLSSLSKRKDIIHPILAYAIQVLAHPKDARQVDGALRMIGELAVQLIKSKKYKKDVEKLLDAHVINHLTAEARFVRARAAWTMKQFSGAQFHNKKILKKAVETLVKVLCNDAEELPACVESALALQNLLEDQERAHDMIQPRIGQIIPKVLSLVARSQIEDVVAVMDDLMEQFMEDVIPIAADITEQLASMFLQIMTSEVAEDRTPAMMSIISTLSTILEVVCEHREIMVKMETSVLKIIDHVFSTANMDFYDEVLLLIQSLIMNYVSEPMWKVFDMLYHVVKQDNGITIMFADVVPALHLYVVTDTESFLARPERLNAIIDMCKSILDNPEAGDEDQLHAAKMLEILLLQCNGMINEAIPAILLIALERLTKPFEDGITELKHMLLLVVIAALYTNRDMAIQVLRDLAPDHPNPLDYVTEQLTALSTKFEGVHNRRMAILGWCTLLELPANIRPSLVTYDPKKVLQSFLSIFTGLQRALKQQAENRKADDSDSEDDSDDEDDDHRNIDDDLSDNEDEIDESTVHYLETLSKEQKKAAGDVQLVESDDDDDDSLFEEETDTEQFATLIDGQDTGPDVFVQFKNTIRGFQQTENMLFQQMIGNLAEEESKQLQELDKECDNHIKAEESKKLKEAGGFVFSGEAVNLGSFNFGS